jgi:RIO kinase 1
LGSQYAKEIWALYEDGELKPGVELKGNFAEATELSDVGGVLEEIKAVLFEEQKRQERLAEDKEES